MPRNRNAHELYVSASMKRLTNTSCSSTGSEKRKSVSFDLYSVEYATRMLLNTSIANSVRKNSAMTLIASRSPTGKLYRNRKAFMNSHQPTTRNSRNHDDTTIILSFDSWRSARIWFPMIRNLPRQYVP